MGTSQSSTGPGAGVALVPPWAEDVPSDDPTAPAPTTPPTIPTRTGRKKHHLHDSGTRVEASETMPAMETAKTYVVRSATM